jgi:hypothetical protein
MYKDSPEAGALIPVYCLGLENNCEKLPHICDTGPCLQDECYVEKYCYRLEKRGNRLNDLFVPFISFHFNQNKYIWPTIENRSMECKRGKPAAIESKREYALLEEIANRSCKIFTLMLRILLNNFIWILGTGFDSSHKIATAGKVRARTTTLIWDDWDVSTDAINEILMAAGIQINIQDYDQTLHMRIIITPEGRINIFSSKI